jgi:hypothetical protein
MMLKMSLFPCLVLSFSQIWLNLPMDDGHFGYITKALIHTPVRLKLFYPRIA